MEKYTYALLVHKNIQTENDQGETSFFNDLHLSLQSDFDMELRDANKIKTEIIQKTTSSLRNGLSSFLSTPLQSDNNEIDRAIADKIENVLTQLGVGNSFSTIRQFTYKVLEPSQVPLHRQLVGVIRRLLKNGKTLLAEAGVTYGKNSGGIYYTIFPTDEFSTLPVLKEKIDSFTKKNPASQYSITNDCIASTLITLASEPTGSAHTILINFDADDHIVDTLNSRLAILMDQFSVRNIRLSKRSFSMGFGSQYQLQFGVDLNKQPLGTIILSLAGDDTELEDVLTTQGSLIVLEKIA